MGIIKDPTSWRAGFELGLAGFSFPYSKPRKPTAYLYNGIRLPALPEWDRGVYPYAVISKTYYEGRYRLSFESVKPSVGIEDSTGNIWYRAEGGSGIKYSVYLDFGETEWGHVLTHSGYSSHRLEHLIWANHDVLNMDGTLYLAASDPVPVYE